MSQWSFENIQTFSNLTLRTDVYRRDAADLLGVRPPAGEAWDVQERNALDRGYYNVATTNVGILRQMREAYIDVSGQPDQRR